MAKKTTILLLLAALFGLAVPGVARAQWGPSGDFEGEKDDEGGSGGKKGDMSVSAGLRLTTFGRHMHLTHLSVRPRPALPFMHTHLGVEPLLDLQFCLGEGTGASLAMELLDAATRVLCDIKTFEEVAIVDVQNKEKC